MLSFVSIVLASNTILLLSIAYLIFLCCLTIHGITAWNNSYICSWAQCDNENHIAYRLFVVSIACQHNQRARDGWWWATTIFCDLSAGLGFEWTIGMGVRQANEEKQMQ